MRYSFLSPHQFNSLAEFIDTWLITSHSPWPLDIAAPNTASQLIVRRLVDAVKE